MLNQRRRDNGKTAAPEQTGDFNQPGWESSLRNPFSCPSGYEAVSRFPQEAIDLARLLSVFDGVSEIREALEPFVHELLHLDRDAITGVRQRIEGLAAARLKHPSPSREPDTSFWKLAKDLARPVSLFLRRFIKDRQEESEAIQLVPSREGALHRTVLLACYAYSKIYDQMNPNWIEESTTFFFYPDPNHNQFREGAEVHTWPTLSLFGEPQYLTDHQKEFLIQRCGSKEVLDAYAKKAELMKKELLRVLQNIV